MLRLPSSSVLLSALTLALATAAGCMLDHQGQAGEGPLCGNSVREQGEECDGAAPDGVSCESLALGAGELACSADCALDTSDCVPLRCGNGELDGGEDCEVTVPITEDCLALGFAAGELSCGDGCRYDTSACVPVGCGNGVLDPTEVCDGELLGSEDCASQGLEPGELRCTDTCELDVTGCPGCGNGVMEVGESCDGTDFGTVSCDGALACTEGCFVDATGCDLSSVGEGRDGDLTVATVRSATDVGARSFAVIAIGGASVTLPADATGLAVGDEVMLINLQGSPTACTTVGAYEFLTVSALAGAEVTFSDNVQGIYGVGGSNADLTGQKPAIVRVPHFASLRLTEDGVINADAWNGAVGGLFVARVSQELRIESGGSIAANAVGFRGGAGHTNSDEAHGWPGESYCGPATTIGFASNFGAGGGGKASTSGDACGQGGGGGAFSVAGTWQPFPSSCVGAGHSDAAENGGLPYGVAELWQLYLGSGGGGGATDDNSDDSGAGGAAGGLILLFARSAVVHGTISAAGAPGAHAGDDHDAGNGGGGSGGSIHLHVGDLQGTGSVVAPGGAGYPSQHGWNSGGGDGGAGRIRIDYHHAAGEPYGTLTAADFINALAEPDPGHSAMSLD